MLNDGTVYEGGTGFGFRRSALCSVFDIWPEFIKTVERSWNNASLCEDIIIDELGRVRAVRENELVIYRNAKLRRIGGIRDGLDDGLLSFIKDRRSEFDIILCDKDGRILMAVEIDGWYHRFYSSVISNDAKKNSIVKAAGGAFCEIMKNRQPPEEINGSFIFLRIPCDGSTCLETDELQAMLKESADEAAVIPDGIITLDKFAERAVQLAAQPQEKILRYNAPDRLPDEKLAVLFGDLNGRYQSFLSGTEGALDAGDTGTQLDAIREFLYSHVNFSRYAEAHYEREHFQQMYLLRYMAAYACDCALSYSRVKDKLIGENTAPLNILSIGCGSCVDHWAASYVFDEICDVNYTGVDLENWRYIAGDPENDPDLEYHGGTDALEYLRDTYRAGEPDEKTSDISLYVFAKSVSDLTPIWQDLCTGIADIRHSSDKIAFLSIYRTTKEASGNAAANRSYERDAEKMSILKDIMEENGYELIEGLSDDAAVDPYPVSDEFPDDFSTVFRPRGPVSRMFGFLRDWLRDSESGLSFIQDTTNEILDKCLRICADNGDNREFDEIRSLLISHGLADTELHASGGDYFRFPMTNLETRCQLLVFKNRDQ